MILRAFQDNPHILHIELGAGCGNFGQVFFPECFLSDKDIAKIRLTCPSSLNNVHEVDAYSIPCTDGRFEKIVVCNPYGYGFRDSDEAKDLLVELHRVSRKDAEVIIVTHNRNPYSNPERVAKRIRIFNAGITKFDINISNVSPQATFAGYTFYRCDGTETKPDYQITLKCLK